MAESLMQLIKYRSVSAERDHVQIAFASCTTIWPLSAAPAQHSFDHGIRLFLFQQRHAACVGLSVCIHDQKLTLRAVCHTVAELHQPLGADIRNKEAIIAIERGSDRQNITENGFVGGRAAVAKLAHCRLLRHTGHSCKIPNERCVEKVIQCTK